MDYLSWSYSETIRPPSIHPSIHPSCDWFSSSTLFGHATCAIESHPPPSVPHLTSTTALPRSNRRFLDESLLPHSSVSPPIHSSSGPSHNSFVNAFSAIVYIQYTIYLAPVWTHREAPLPPWCAGVTSVLDLPSHGLLNAKYKLNKKR